MSVVFNKKRLFTVFFLTITVVLIPLLLIYQRYKKFRLKYKLPDDETVLVCDCCGDWKRESETVPYIQEDKEYIVCSEGQASSNKNLQFAFDRNKYIKYLYPF